MPTIPRTGYVPDRKTEVANRSHRAWCPSTEKIEWFRNRTVFRAFLWFESRSDIANVTPNAFTISERFGNQRSFLFEFRVRNHNGEETLVAVRRSGSLELGDDGRTRPAFWSRVSAYCTARSLQHRFLTDDDLAPYAQRIDNWQRVLPYLHRAFREPDADLVAEIENWVAEQGLATIGSLAERFSGSNPEHVISQAWHAVWRNTLSVNMDEDPWSVNTLIAPSDGRATPPPAHSQPTPCVGPRPAHPTFPNTWATLPAESIEDDAKRAGYVTRRRMVWSVLMENTSIAAVARTNKCTERWVRNVIERCQRITPSGEPWGWEGAVPHARWPYSRDEKKSAGSESDPAAVGHALSRLFARNPDIEAAVVAAALPKRGRGKAISGRRKPLAKAVWKKFLTACELAGIQQSAWPYTTQNKGREAIRRYCKRLIDRHANAHIEVHVGDGGTVVWEATQPNRTIQPIVRPYEQFQADGHDSNAYASISVPDAVGLPCYLPLGRFWLIVSVDVGSRAAMGAAITSELNYASHDLLDCLADAVTPETLLRPYLPESSYRSGAGMPSDIWPFCQWRSMDTIQLDNALAHVSRETQERIVETFGATVITNLPAHPTSNAIAERFFGSFESVFGFGPSSTGSNPSDPRREDPVKAAVQNQIALYHLEGLAHSILANHNATPHEALNGRSPLQYLHDWHRRDPLLARFVPDGVRDDLPLYFRTFEACVQRNEKQGGRCYVQWLYARHTNDTLASTPSLAKEPVLLVVDCRDARRVWAYTRDGKALGQLEPQNRWALREHTLRERRLIGKFQRLALMDPDMTDPVGDMHEVIEAEAKTDRQARRRLAARQQRHGSVGDATEKDARPSEATPDEAPRDWVPIRRHYYR